uniref:lysozyme n=1 Tax=Harmonia axyridis TaxID=115357 RepID=A0A0A7M643_HARAX|nr:c-type lysozyme 3 [Harmonia axyridis]
MKLTLKYFLLLFVLWNGVEAKIFGRCEFVAKLRSLGIPGNQLATWTCIANFESHFDTKAVNSQTGDYGILQISEIYWCSNSNTPGKGCHATCSQFLNDDINDDVACARHVFDETQRWSGNGFTAWTTYDRYCKGNVDSFIANC